MALWSRMFMGGFAGLTLAAMTVSAESKGLEPIPAPTVALMTAKDTSESAPILMRVFKKEAELEVWKMSRSGRYTLLKTFPICRWSGQLGPKTAQGDRQSPEGFYSVGPRQMNPNSSFHLSFDLGYPNAYDRAHGATGAFLMVHGICSSAGCFAMTNAQITEIYALAREAFEGGQKAFQVQSYPFRMTAQNMARARTEKHIDFWRQLKEGYDRFEATGEEPAVGVAGGRYVFAPYRNPANEAAAQARRRAEDEKTAALVADGSAAVRVTYADGGMHPSFVRRAVEHTGAISRPETLALAGREVVVIAARRKPAPVAVAAASAPPRHAAGAELGVASLFSPVPLGPARGAAPLASFAGSPGILPASWSPAPVKLALQGA